MPSSNALRIASATKADKGQTKGRSARPSPHAGQSLDQIAKALLAKNNNSILDAAADMEAAIAADDELFRQLMLPLLKNAVYAVVSKNVGRQRETICNLAREAHVAISGAKALQDTATSMLDFPLFGGKRLRDANATEIIESADKYDGLANDARIKSRWLRSVAAKIGDSLVIDKLSEAELVRLFRQASKQ
jgi:hypothetical protein